MTKQDSFLLVTVAVVVLGLASLTLIGTMQYTADRDHHRQSTTVTNDYVTNLPWSLLNEDKK